MRVSVFAAHIMGAADTDPFSTDYYERYLIFLPYSVIQNQGRMTCCGIVFELYAKTIPQYFFSFLKGYSKFRITDHADRSIRAPRARSFSSTRS